jgi:hypothetical protein
MINFNEKAVLLFSVDFAYYVDFRCMHETPAGKAGLGRPRRRFAPRRLPYCPRGTACLSLQSTGKFNTANVKEKSPADGGQDTRDLHITFQSTNPIDFNPL